MRLASLKVFSWAAMWTEVLLAKSAVFRTFSFENNATQPLTPSFNIS
ncbi:hypothetical protein ALO62_102975 [Pseudomonas amygdali pv. myricae]|uniref:Uncharacterized protein n=1 Tax=Pseudomonas amygdali pv. eriobotryae TaxID=129137 RepID=A0A0P9UZ34_PSEA0|nr:Unknown protein sequence [Pseudomonas amygdali pv. myricae]KPX30963.1 hypothetical protein ALO70_102525 [Pseudomonas amygdali pv. eriobotryae]KPX99105.1 hypothetical protein ALO62_102975 [Pseudomonas amygdali pv. myricae]RMM03378.1 hypothetical protein ALQ86_102683 [Pseudomonas amygdali pv. eriobotryae]